MIGSFLFACSYAVFVFLLFGMVFFLYVLVHVCIILIYMLKWFVRMSWFCLFLCSVRFLSFGKIIFSVGIYVCHICIVFVVMGCFGMCCFCVLVCVVLVCLAFVWCYVLFWYVLLLPAC